MDLEDRGVRDIGVLLNSWSMQEIVKNIVWYLYFLLKVFGVVLLNEWNCLYILCRQVIEKNRSLLYCIFIQVLMSNEKY